MSALPVPDGTRVGCPVFPTSQPVRAVGRVASVEDGRALIEWAPGFTLPERFALFAAVQMSETLAGESRKSVIYLYLGRSESSGSVLYFGPPEVLAAVLAGDER